MNERVKYPLVITLICLVAAAGLAATFALTKDNIQASRQAEFNAALGVVLPQGEPKAITGADDPAEQIYKGVAGSGVTGYAARGEAQGYSSRIRVLVGVTPDRKHIVAIRILEQQETPGLGERTKEVPPTKTLWEAIGDGVGGLVGGGAATTAPAAAEPPFQAQFRDKTVADLDLNTPDGIDGLTGATITSRAVVTAVRDAVARIDAAVAAKAEGGP
jgi:Na+-translocating ferredoxin:NAD+ oxidoreductase RnfG subunit